MKTPTTYTPYLLSISLALVFVAMLAVTKTQMTPQPVYLSSASSEAGTRLNQPGPKEKRMIEEEIEEEIEEGNPVFLKEDVKEEIGPGAARFTANNNTEKVTDTAEDDWIEQQTKLESNAIIGTDRYLVLAGAYTDNMMLLSKQAQYTNKGFDAEIIRFAHKKGRYICLGRFEQEKQAAAFAKNIGEQLDIKMHILDKNN